MNIGVIYVFPMNGREYMANAMRFCNTYTENRTSEPHHLIVCCNGGDPTDEQRQIFNGIRCIFLPMENDGYDIGSYQRASQILQESDSGFELAVFFGSTTYIKTPIWLTRMKQSFLKHGDTLYGCMGNAGDASVRVEPHIRTTAFWISPTLMNEYPHAVDTPDKRYEFEHGKSCLTSWIRYKGKKPMVVTRTGEYELPEWDLIPNGFHRGDQSALLAGDRISMPPFYHTP